MQKKTILIAEDDKAMQDLFTETLSKGYNILNAHDGADALMMASQHMPDLILLDIMMPVLDGRTVCKKLKSNPSTQSIKIIMLTAKDQQHDRLVGFEVGADDYITKPCSVHYLELAVNKALRQ